MYFRTPLVHQSCLPVTLKTPCLSALCISLTCIILSCILLSCTSTSPTPATDLRSASIGSSLAGGTEGLLRTSYTYTIIHEPSQIHLKYQWSFEDSSAVVTTDTNRITHSFTHVGFYLVSCRIFNSSTSTELGRATMVTNIRSTPPAIEMVRIPAGSFMMGSNKGIDQNEQPLHQVRINRDILVARYELKQWQWNAVLPTTLSWFQSDSLPVETVSWFDAIDFCNRLSLRSGLQSCYTVHGDSVQCNFDANGYRLPTEAEWEYCARAGSTTDFYSGDARHPYSACLSGDSLEPCIDSIGWYCHNADAHTHRCGLKAANAFGLFDMIGNVSEWTWDWCDGKYYANSASTDPTGSPSGVSRAVRGGDFVSGTIDIRVASRRLSIKPQQRVYSTGFRVVRNQ